MPAAPLQPRRSPPTSVPGPAPMAIAAVPSRTGAPTDRLSGAERAQAREAHSYWPLIWSALVAAILFWGMKAPLDRYLTPQRGLGYWLGIVGGSMMLLLLIYSARKRFLWLSWMGTIPAWFRVHITLGVVGPLLVLFHTGFHLGATNSNVALICMLLVAGSGVVGRYLYTRIHSNLHGTQANLQALRAASERIRTQTTSLAFFPELMAAIQREESRLFREDVNPLGRLLQVLSAAPRTALARWRLHRAIRGAVKKAVNHESVTVARHARRIYTVARDYVDRRLDAGRRAAEYEFYVRLFSLWHVLHIPLFFMLLIAGIVHVIAVNVY